MARLPYWLYSDHHIGEAPTDLRTRSWGSRYTVLHVIRMPNRYFSVWMISARGLCLAIGPEDAVAEGRISAREGAPGFRSLALLTRANGRAFELSYAPPSGES